MRLKPLKYLLLSVLALSSWQVRAQTYPTSNKVINVISAYPAGTGADTTVRHFAGKLAGVSGLKVVVENKVGMITVIASDYVARSKPDGYTLFITPGNAHAASPFAVKKLPFDPVKDFTPVTTLSKSSAFLIVDSSSPYGSIKALTAALIEKGGKASYAYTSWTALAASELYKLRTGVQALGIPFKGAPQTLPSLNSGEIDFQFVDAGMAVQQIRAGRWRGLAVTGTERSSVLPDLPTMVESGIPEFDISPWWAVFMPSGVPQPIVEKLEGWFNEILVMDDTKKYLADQGATAFHGNSRLLSEHLAKEIRKWGDLLKLAKVEPQ